MRLVSWLALTSAAGAANMFRTAAAVQASDNIHPGPRVCLSDAPPAGIKYLAAKANEMATPGNPCVVWGSHMAKPGRYYCPLQHLHFDHAKFVQALGRDSAYIHSDWGLYDVHRALKAPPETNSNVPLRPIDFALALMAHGPPRRLIVVTASREETNYCVEAARRTKSPVSVVVIARHYYDYDCFPESKSTIQYSPANATADELAAWVGFTTAWIEQERHRGSRHSVGDIDPAVAARTVAECIGCDTAVLGNVCSWFGQCAGRLSPEDTAGKVRDLMRAFATARVRDALDNSSEPALTREVLRRAADPANKQLEPDSQVVRDLVWQQLITLERGVARLRWPVVAAIPY